MNVYYDLTWTCGILEAGSIDLCAAESTGLRRMILSGPVAIEPKCATYQMCPEVT